MKLGQYKKHKGYEWFKYQWEFARRSEEYQSIYENKERAHLPLEVSRMLPDPGLSFEEVLQQKENEEGGGLSGLINALQFLSSGAVILESVSKGTLRIEIDFKKINQIDSLKKYVEFLIDNHYKGVLISLNEIPKRNLRKKRDWEKILRVGDLKSKNKDYSFEAIAAEIDPERYNKNPNSAVSDVKRLNNEYDRLISGGWKELRYP